MIVSAVPAECAGAKPATGAKLSTYMYYFINKSDYMADLYMYSTGDRYELGTAYPGDQCFNSYIRTPSKIVVYSVKNINEYYGGEEVSKKKWSSGKTKVNVTLHKDLTCSFEFTN